MAARLASGALHSVERLHCNVVGVVRRDTRRLGLVQAAVPTSTWHHRRAVSVSACTACRGSGRVEIVLPPERDEFGRIKKKWWQRRGA